MGTRLDTQLDKLYRFTDGQVRSLRDELARRDTTKKSEGDGMIDWNRRRFNAMGSNAEQAAYEARLKAKRYYYIDNLQVAKIVYDAF